MFRPLLCAAVLTFAFMNAARAEPVPQAALDKDYDNCLGGETEQSDPQRAQYCACVRDGMRGWDMDTYGNAAQQAANASAQSPPAALADLAKSCIAKVLK